MQNPPDRPEGVGIERLSPEERRRARRAALFRPMNLLMVVIGALFFAITLEWWIIPLTLATYAALILVAPHDQVVRNKVLERREHRLETQSVSLKGRDVPLERRVRRLPHGEVRQKVEAALAARRRTALAIEESGDIARTVLGDVIPKLDCAVEHLALVAEKREKATRMIRDSKTSTDASRHEYRGVKLEKLEKKVRAADAEIYSALDQLSTLRARVVRISTESEDIAQDAAAKLNADLDALNLRLDALRSTVFPPDDRQPNC
jgi:chromosome segregation ATPase